MKSYAILGEQACYEQQLAELLRRNNVNTLIDSPETIALKLGNMTAVSNELNRFLTNDPLMLDTKARCAKLAPLMDTVLIIGPTGTGKEILAKALGGSRPGFLPLNCAALSPSLVESELFGHRRGSFTDAKEDREGVLSAAGEGTVYLDEIDKMNPSVQAKLLRAIQEHEIRRVGSAVYERIECRFICSSKVSLETLLDKGFLEDLYARISTFELVTTPLKDRWDDVSLILRAMLISIGKLPEDYTDEVILPEYWRPKVERFNVRGLESYREHLRVFGE
jgi:DNA-binding NtrC family response regulator